MLVDMYKKDGYWYFDDMTGIAWTTNLIVGSVEPKEAKPKEVDSSVVDNALDLKEAGFAPDDIFRLLRK